MKAVQRANEHFSSMAEGKSERSDIADWIDALATNNGLERLVNFVNAFTTGQFEIVGGAPYLSEIVSPSNELESLCYAVLKLAEGYTGYYVIKCRHCNKFVLKYKGAHTQGAKAKFCNHKHSNAYQQKVFRHKKNKKGKGNRK